MSTVNLCFHGVGTPQRELEPGESVYWISEQTFHDVLDLVAERPHVQISFDDGNASDYRIGLPGLLARGLRATFFPLAQRVDQAGSTSAAELRELVAAGMAIGSHGMRHLPWRGMTDTDLDAELVTAREQLAEASGVGITEAACPLGRYDRRVLARLRGLGYQRVYTSDRAWARPGSWLQPRYSIHQDDTVAAMQSIFDDRPGFGSRVKSAARVAAKRLR